MREDQAVAAVRRTQAFELRKNGASYSAIGRALGVSNVSAFRYVKHVLADLAGQSRGLAEHYRAMQLERLQDMVLSIMPAVKRGDPQAHKVLLGIMEREAKLLGLDAPTRIDLQGRLRQEAIAQGLDPDELIREAEQIIAGL